MSFRSGDRVAGSAKYWRWATNALEVVDDVHFTWSPTSIAAWWSPFR